MHVACYRTTVMEKGGYLLLHNGGLEVKICDEGSTPEVDRQVHQRADGQQQAVRRCCSGTAASPLVLQRLPPRSRGIISRLKPSHVNVHSRVYTLCAGGKVINDFTGASATTNAAIQRTQHPRTIARRGKRGSKLKETTADA